MQLQIRVRGANVSVAATTGRASEVARQSPEDPTYVTAPGRELQAQRSASICQAPRSFLRWRNDRVEHQLLAAPSSQTAEIWEWFCHTLIVIIVLHDGHQLFSRHGHGLQILMMAQLAATPSC